LAFRDEVFTLSLTLDNAAGATREAANSRVLPPLPRWAEQAEPPSELCCNARLDAFAAGETIVAKFGGTSLATPARIRTVAGMLGNTRDGGARLVAVVSAMGATTDDLIELAQTVTGRPRRRELDMLLASGECVSTALLTLALVDLGYSAVALSGAQAGILTDSSHGRAQIVDVQPHRVRAELAEGKIVLVTGFQGVSSDGDVTTLGRGGSDASAVALAAALHARCLIYTDVDGVYTADPRRVPVARKLALVDYAQMLELASAGATVLQPQAVELARLHGVELEVRSAFADREGTSVTATRGGSMFEQTLVAAVTQIDQEELYAVESVSSRRLAASLAEGDVRVDMLVRRGAEVYFAAPSADHDELAEILKHLDVPYTARTGFGRVTVVGAGIGSDPQVVATALGALDDAGIEPELVVTSPTRLACHVPSEDVRRAAEILHESLGLSQAATAPAGA
jgi:aspartate kinase